MREVSNLARKETVGRDILEGKRWRSNRRMQGARTATDGDWEL